MPGVAIALAVTLAQAPPQPPPEEHRDPRPRTFDPPRGRYRLPDGTIVVADPPWGFYDPPPGLYPRTTTTSPSLEQRAARGVVLGPLPTADASLPAWRVQRRRLRIALGVSAGVFVATALVPLFGGLADRAGDPGIKGMGEWPTGTLVAVIGAPIGLLATIITGTLLAVHNRRHPRAPHRLQTNLAGLRLSF